MPIVRSRLLAAIALSLTLSIGFVSGTLAQDATPVASPVASPVATGTVEVTGLVANPATVSVADLQLLPSQTVEVDFESGKDRSITRMLACCFGMCSIRQVS